MLITESQMYSSSYNINNVYSLLESMYYIPNQDDNPQLIPVIENTQVGKVLIPLEELYEYKVNKGYSNLVYALEDVCYTNNIDSSYVGFTINDYSLLENTYYPVLVNTLLENGICVLCKNRIDYALNEALDQCLYEAVVNNDHTLMTLLLEDDNNTVSTWIPEIGSDGEEVAITLRPNEYNNPGLIAVRLRLALQGKRDSKGRPLSQDVITQRANEIYNAVKTKDTPDKPADPKPGARRYWDPVTNSVKELAPDQSVDVHGRLLSKDKKKIDPSFVAAAAARGIDVSDEGNNRKVVPLDRNRKEDAQDAQKTIQTLENIQKYEYKDVNVFRRKIAQMMRWAHKKAAEYNKKLYDKQAKGEDVAWYQKILRYITRFIEWGTRKIHNLAAGNKEQIEDKTFQYEYKKNDDQNQTTEAKNDAKATEDKVKENNEKNS